MSWNGNNSPREEDFLGVPLDLGGVDECVPPLVSSSTLHGRNPAMPEPSLTSTPTVPLPTGLSPTELPSAVNECLPQWL